VKTTDAGRLWRTVRTLRREQLLGRLVHEARQRAFSIVPPLLPLLLGAPGQAPAVALRLSMPSRDPEQHERAQQLIRTGRARLAGHEVGARDWKRANLPKLVRYHLQYLDVARDLAEAGEGAAALELAQAWIAEHPLQGSEAWEPYPVAARLQNLCIVAGLAGPEAPAWLREQLLLHARFLARWPEVHLQGNHLLKDFCALALAGLILDGAEAAQLKQQGLEGLQAQLDEQVLADGGHYERSPMYHLLALADLLDVRDFARAREEQLPWLETRIAAMASFAAGILHPDGEIPLFNDAVIGQAPTPAKLFARLDRPPITDARLCFDAAQFGLSVLRPSKLEAVVFDSGPLGPEHQPGHAHSDTLSYELSIGGERRAVNAGVDGYQSSNRAFFRSAAAHNTVTVDGDGPDELWSAFRVGGRSAILARGAADRGGWLEAWGSLRAFQGWTHHRTVALFPGRALLVFDWIEAFRHAVVASSARLVPGKIPLRFMPLFGEPSTHHNAYAPRMNAVHDLEVQRVQSRGRQVVLGYALLWGAQAVIATEVPTGVVVTVDGVRVELLKTR
jgi:hypothetical protein